MTIVRLTQFDRPGLASNPTLLEARYICWTQAEVSFGIMAATFPAARRFAADLITYYNGGTFGSMDAGSTLRTDTLALTPLHATRFKSQISSDQRDVPQAVHTGNWSQEMMIVKEVTVEIDLAPSSLDTGPRGSDMEQSSTVF